VNIGTTKTSDNKFIVGTAWTTFCIDTIDCVQAADLQQKEIAPNQGNWLTIKGGPSTAGCGAANIASVSVACFPEATFEFSYRTQGIFNLITDDGPMTQSVKTNTGLGPYKLNCG
jgi:hypothetical protein